MKHYLKTPTCCGKESVYVDNVPGKEYYYCRECKNEVIQTISPQTINPGKANYYTWPMVIEFNDDGSVKPNAEPFTIERINDLIKLLGKVRKI